MQVAETFKYRVVKPLHRGNLSFATLLYETGRG